MGLERLLLQRLRSVVWRLHGWSNFPDRDHTAAWTTCPGSSTNSVMTRLTAARLLDVFSLHNYPQGGESSGDDVSTAMQLRRNRSTRSLWDPNYMDETWINAVVELIPRMKSWVNTYYPGTQDRHHRVQLGRGSTYQRRHRAGRHPRHLRTRGVGYGDPLDNPGPRRRPTRRSRCTATTIGAKSTFGETSVSATAPNPDNVAAFAAERSKDGALTIMVISKYLSGQTPVTVNLANFPKSGKASVWQLTAAEYHHPPAGHSVKNGKLRSISPQPEHHPVRGEADRRCEFDN